MRPLIINLPKIEDLHGNRSINEEDEIKDQQKESSNFQEIIEIRKKYPHLQAIDQMTSDWITNDTDKNLLEDYFKERAGNIDTI